MRFTDTMQQNGHLEADDTYASILQLQFTASSFLKVEQSLTDRLRARSACLLPLFELPADQIYAKEHDGFGRYG